MVHNPHAEGWREIWTGCLRPATHRWIMMGDQSGRRGREGEKDKKDDKVELFSWKPGCLVDDVEGFPSGIMIKVICEMVSLLVSVYSVWQKSSVLCWGPSSLHAKQWTLVLETIWSDWLTCLLNILPNPCWIIWCSPAGSGTLVVENSLIMMMLLLELFRMRM